MDNRRDTPLAQAAFIASQNHGIVAFAQLKRCGWSKTMVHGAVRRGALHATRFTGVFSVGTPITTAPARAMAAVLAVEGLLSHHWCRWLFGVGRLPHHDPDVTVTRNRRARAGLTLHRSRVAPEPDANHGVPCTRPERMVIDCAPDLTPRDLRRLVNDVQVEHLVAYPTLKAAVERTRGRDTAALRDLLAEDQPGATRSLLEDLLLELCRDHGLPVPLVNALVDGYEVDFAFHDGAVIVEADGYVFHSTRQQFGDDRVKWLALEAAGRTVVPVGYRQVTELRERTARQLLAVLRR